MIAASAEMRQLLTQSFPSDKIDVSPQEFPLLLVDPQDLIDTLGKLKEAPFNLNALSVIAAADYPDEGVIEIVYYLFSYADQAHRLQIKVRTPRDNANIPSIVNLWEGANFQEREIYDLFGVKFEGHPNMERIFLPEDFPGHPYRKDVPLFKDEEYLTRQDWPTPHIFDEHEAKEIIINDEGIKTQKIKLNMGPQHPSAHGVLLFYLTVDGERIKETEIGCGYIHRSFEKIAENREYQQIPPLMDRMDYLAGANNEFSYVLAAEKILGIDIPAKAEYLRVIMAELYRIGNHLLFYGAITTDIGAITPALYAWREREKILDLVEMLAGMRLHPNYFVVGGVRWDVFPEFIQKAYEFCNGFPQYLQEYHDLVSGNEIFIVRTKGVGLLSPEHAIDLCLTGPHLRATGMDWDVRKGDPYSRYDEFDFEIPTGTQGDLMDSYMVRMLEMRESAKIIRQALAKLEGVLDEPHRLDLPVEVMLPEGEAYARHESVKGEHGTYLVSKGGPRPYRLKVRPPSLINLQSVAPLAKDFLIADLVAIIGAIDPNVAETDR